MAYIIRLAIALFSLSLIHFSSAEASSSEDVPNWLVPIVKSYSDAKNNAVLIAEYEFQNQRVYVVDRTKACCDLGADMYSEAGQRICRFIGYAGAWEDHSKPVFCQIYENLRFFTRRRAACA